MTRFCVPSIIIPGADLLTDNLLLSDTVDRQIRLDDTEEALKVSLLETKNIATPTYCTTDDDND